MREWTPEEIKKLRQALKLSQRAFADFVGVTRNYIYYLERGVRIPNKTLQKLFEYIEKETKEKEVKKHGKRAL